MRSAWWRICALCMPAEVAMLWRKRRKRRRAVAGVVMALLLLWCCGLGYVLAFDAARLAFGGAVLEPHQRLFHLCDGDRVLPTRVLGVEHLRAVDQDSQQGFVRDAVDADLGDGPVLEQQGSASLREVVAVALNVGAVSGFADSVARQALVVGVNTGHCSSSYSCAAFRAARVCSCQSA